MITSMKKYSKKTGNLFSDPLVNLKRLESSYFFVIFALAEAITEF